MNQRMARPGPPASVRRPPARNRVGGGPGPASPSGWARRIRRLWQSAEFLALAIVLAYAAAALDNQPDLLSRHLHRALTALGLPTGPQAVPVTSQGSLRSAPTRRTPATGPAISFALPARGLPATPAPSLTGSETKAYSPLVVWEYRIPTLGADPAQPQAAGVVDAIDEFRERYPGLEVQVRWWNEAEILEGLIQALTGPASGVPDVVALPSPWVTASQPLRLAAPVATRIREEVVPSVWSAVALPATGKRVAAWMIPRWMEGQCWITSRPFWSKAGMDLTAVARAGWTYDQVDGFLQKAVGSAGARSVRPPVLQVASSPSSWAALLTAASVPAPYAWKEDPGSGEGTIPSPDQLIWSDTVLTEILSAWRGWWNRLYPDANKQKSAREAWRSEVFQWLPTLRDGRPLLAGPVRPAALRPLLRPFFFSEWAAEPEPDRPATPDAGDNQAGGVIAVGAVGNGRGSESDSSSAVAVVPIPGPRLPAPRLATLSGYVLPSRPTGGRESASRAQLAQELALLLARRTARWAAQELAFVPAWREDLAWAREYWLGHAATTGWGRVPEALVWLQVTEAWTPAALLPEALAQAREQALQALSSLVAPALAGETPGEDLAAQIARLLSSPYQ